MSYPYSVSFVLIAFNQEAFIKAACASALNQEGESIEIILSDDCSTDRTYEIMQEMVQQYRGCHRVILNRTKTNLGLVEHINQVVQLSKGDVIIYAAGDDISITNRVLLTMKSFEQKESPVLLVHSCVQEIDKNGCNLSVWYPPIFGKHFNCEQLAQKYSLVIGATCAWHRSIWDVFGRLSHPNIYEDAVMALRACMLGGNKSLVFVDEPLVLYRINEAGLSQGGRNKPTNRSERRSFELKRLRTRNAICLQRLDDARKIQSTEVIKVLEQEQKNNNMTRLVYEKEIGWLQLMSIAVKTNTISAFLSASLKRFRVM